MQLGRRIICSFWWSSLFGLVVPAVASSYPHPLMPASARSDSAVTSGWLSLAPLPDKTGFAGMFAGVLSGRLVCGGGSQFADRPVWLQGTKAYSDQIFVLREWGGEWARVSTRLPAPLAHFATAATDNAIYLVGGCNETGVRAEAYAIQDRAGDLVIERLPDLPEPRAYASAAVMAGRLYVAGGQPDLAVKRISAMVWSLDLARPQAGWRREPDMPAAMFVAAMAATPAGIFHFGGVKFDAEGKGVQLREAFRLAPGSDRWEAVAPLPEPRVGAVSPVPVLPDGSLFLIGGYAASFPGAPRDHPGFSRQTLVYRPEEDVWTLGPLLPHELPVDRDVTGDTGPAPMVAAPSVVWNGHAIVIGGEVRASVRTPCVIAWPLDQPLHPATPDN